MFEIYFLWVLGFIWILFAVISDLKTREIPNWLNYSLVIFALSFRLLYSLFELNSFDFFYQGLMGFGLFFILGNLFYYGKLFAGGDAKLFMALGAVLPIFNFKLNLEIFLIFIFLFLVCGAIYGIIVSFYFGIKNFSKLKIEFPKQNKLNNKFILLFLIFSFIIFLLSFFIWELFYFGLFIFIVPYFYLYVKSVDEACMVKFMKTSLLTPGDWLYEDLEIGKRKIKATWDGLTEEEISFLKKKRERVLVRWGIQFAPVFLMSFILFIFVLKFRLFIF